MRTRVTLIATAIATVVLLVAAVVVVALVRRELDANLDHSLAQRADQVGAAALTDPASAVANSAGEDRFVQVVDADGTVLFASENVRGQPAVGELPMDDQQSGDRTDIPIEDDRYRVLVRRFDLDPGTRYVIVGENVDDVTDDIRTLVATLALVFPAAVLLLAFATWWLVGRTLRPVEDIRRHVAGIGLDELDQRVPVPGTADEIERLATTMNDMLARLQRSATTQRQFVADVSHELRTPLTRLRTTLEVDLRDPDADFVGTCRASLDETVEMQRLVDDLLFLARRDAGQGIGRTEWVDLDVVIDDEVRRQRADSDVTIEIGATAPIQVRGDRSQLGRMMTNLLSNAVRHASSRVVVELREDEARSIAVIAVDDDGDGIANEHRTRVFDRFVRLDAARSARDGGAGLGLAIVHDIVVAHGGTVTIDEATIGGARFEVRLESRGG